MHCRTLSLALLVAGSWTFATPALPEEPKLKIEARGPSGAPVKGGRISIRGFGETAPRTKLVAGELVVVTVVDDKGNSATKTVAVPKSGSTTVQIDLGPSQPNFDTSFSRAMKAAEDGDNEQFNKHFKDAEKAVENSKEELKQDQAAVDEWASQNNLPILSYGQIMDAIARDKARGITPQNSTTARIMERYAQYRLSLTLRAMSVRNAENLLDDDVYYSDSGTGTIPPVGMAPVVGCPDGQGGGLLAGWINSVTGSDLAAACDIDAKRDKNKKDRERREHEDDHGRD